MASKSGGRKGGGKPPSGRKRADAERQGDDPVVQVRLISSDEAAFTEFVKNTPVEFACAMPRVSAEGIITAEVLMQQSMVEQSLERAEAAKVRLEVVADASSVRGRRLPEVGDGNRFEDPKVLPVGRGALIDDREPRS